MFTIRVGGLLHDFVRDKFPSIDFNLYPEMLKELVKLIQIDHVVSSGADFDENLWSESASDNTRDRARLLRSATNRTDTRPRRLDFRGINCFFSETKAMPLKRERVGPYVWARVVSVYNRIAGRCEGVWNL